MKYHSESSPFAAYARRIGYPVQADGTFFFVDGKADRRDSEEMLQLIRKKPADPLLLTARLDRDGK